MSSNNQSSSPLKSRLLLVIIVIIAAFLAAFLGQILISSLNTRPSLDLSQPFIIQDQSTAPEDAREALTSVEKTERVTLVEIYAESNDLAKVAEGAVLTNDGWIVSVLPTEPESTQEWTHIRFNSGELLSIEEIVEDSLRSLVYLRVDSLNLTAATLVRDSSIELFDPALILSANGILGKTAYLGETKRMLVELSSDEKNTFLSLEGEMMQGFLYNFSGELMGVMINQDTTPTATAINALTIREGLERLLRDEQLAYPQLGILYRDLALTPQVEQPTAGALITSLSGRDDYTHSADLRVGDLIVSVDGELLNHRLTLSDIVERTSIDDTIELGLIRRGEPVSVEVIVE